ncbi:MAG: class I SAM-dependent methyltransferase [Sphingobacteriaceae bacterium]|nr:class I SAM-dependent methyltransferase [Sphingobacteriaceae bacterium]
MIGKPLFDPNVVHLIRQDYKVVKCKSCQFYYVHPKIDLSLNEWSELYGNEYFLELNEWYKEERLKDIKSRLSRMISYKHTHDKANFLDLGCGEGLALIESLKKKWNAFGCDISDNRTQDAKQNDIFFELSDLISAHYPNDFFDFIHMDSVLEHLINPVDYLKELNRIMKKGGIIYIGVPNENSLFDNFRQLAFKFIGKAKFSAKLRPFETPFHIGGFTEKSLRIIASIADFEVVEIKNFATHFEFRKYPSNSKSFWVHFLTLPIDIFSIPLKMEKYYSAYFRKIK